MLISKMLSKIHFDKKDISVELSWVYTESSKALIRNEIIALV